MEPDEQLRAEMVDRDIAGRGVRDGRVLAAMRAVPRDVFVPAALRDQTYEDHPLPIGADQTIGNVPTAVEPLMVTAPG